MHSSFLHRLGTRVGKLFSDPAFAKKKAFLRSLSIFQGISDRELGHVLQALYHRRYEDGERIFEEGEIGRALFILEAGKVELTKLDGQGRPQRLAVLEPGEFFGEMALLEQLPRSATAAAIESSSVYLLNKPRLDDLLHSHPRVGVSIMRHLAQLLSARLRRTTSSLTSGEGTPPLAQRA